jgi:hypothetical protein
LELTAGVAQYKFYDKDLASIFYKKAKIHRKQPYNWCVLLSWRRGFRRGPRNGQRELVSGRLLRFCWNLIGPEPPYLSSNEAEEGETMTAIEQQLLVQRFVNP